jgi:hypothetical protein
MKNSEKEDYKVCFSGATITQRESNKAGVALVFGLIGIVVIGLAFEIQNKLVLFVIVFFGVRIGYFGIASRLCKNNRK